MNDDYQQPSNADLRVHSELVLLNDVSFEPVYPEPYSAPMQIEEHRKEVDEAYCHQMDHLQPFHVLYNAMRIVVLHAVYGKNGVGCCGGNGMQLLALMMVTYAPWSVHDSNSDH